MTNWLIIVGMASVTYLERLLPLSGGDVNQMPGWFRQSLTYLPIAILSALAASAFVPSEEAFHYVIDARLIVGLGAVLIAWYSRSLVLTIIGGIALYVIF